MKRALTLSSHFTVVILMSGLLCVNAQEFKSIQLPNPQTEGGRPLMQVLKDRKTTREFSSEKLPLQVISNLLWAAFGINRPSGQRTAPSAVNWQEIDVYVALPEGMFLYDAKANALHLVLKEDVRAATGTQALVKDAPVSLVYVADLEKAGRVPETEKEFWSAADVGFIAQNVYLFSASEGLVCQVRALIDRPSLAKMMNLRPKQKILLAQSVGFPRK